MRSLDLFGIKPREKLVKEQQAAWGYLEGRRCHQRCIRDLPALFATSAQDDLKQALKGALARFPDALPFEYEEQRANNRLREDLLEKARIWASWGDPANYTVSPVPDQPEVMAVSFETPVQPSEEFEQGRQESLAAITVNSVLQWAMESLRNSRPQTGCTISAAVQLARDRDKPNLMQSVDDVGSGVVQACVAAVAAVAASMSSDATERAWAWDVLGRVEDIQENDGLFAESRNPYDPRIFLIRALGDRLRAGTDVDASAESLLKLACGGNSRVAQGAISAMLNVKRQPQVVWNAAVAATELFATPEIDFDDVGQRDGGAQVAHRQAVRDRALARLRDGITGRLADVPVAWDQRPRRRLRSRAAEGEILEWQRPRIDFRVDIAAPLMREFPLEDWLASEVSRVPALAYLDQLVRWSFDRLNPPAADRRGEQSMAVELSDWLCALADFVSLTITHLSREEVLNRFVEPLAAGKGDGSVEYTADLVACVVCRHVYDSERVSDAALAILRYCLDRLLQELEFDPSGYRAGELHGFAVPRAIDALLMVSVENANGAVRFANGKWGDLGIVMPVVDRLMSAAGWSDYVMDRYLVLCERAGGAVAIDAFVRHVEASLDVLQQHGLRWRGQSTNARIAGIVQALADGDRPLSREKGRDLLRLLDRLVDLGDRRAAALQQSEHFREIQSQ